MEELIGRTAESAALDRARAQAASGPVLVVITGEPGIGKSALLRSFTRRLVAVGEPVLSGRCVPTDTAAPLLPFAPGLGTRDGAFAELPGLPGTVTGMLEAVVGVAERAAPDHPCVVAVDDLHWADGSTLDLLEALARMVLPHPVLTLVTVRTGLPPDHDVRARLAEWSRLGVEQVRLGPLTDTAVAQVAAAVPERRMAVEEVALSAGGNPFYAQQLAAHGRPEGGVPPDLADLLRHQLSALPAGVLRLVRLLATAGGSAAPDLVELALRAGRSGDDPVPDQAAALDSGLVGYDERRGRLVLRHPLVAETALADLLPDERRRLHHRWATALAERPPPGADRPPAERAAWHADLAQHWMDGGDGGGAATALPHWLAAGEAAEQAEAPTEAVRCLLAALRCQQVVGAPTEQFVALHRALARAADAGQDARAAVEHVEAALALVDAGADPEAAGELHAELARYRWHDSRSSRREVRAAAERALELLPDGALRWRGRAHLELARLTAFSSDDAGLPHARAAVEAARAAGDAVTLTRALATLGTGLVLAGGTEDGLRTLHDAVDEGQRCGGDALVAAHVNLGCSLGAELRLTESTAVFDAALQSATARPGPPDLGRAALRANLVQVLIIDGQWARARREALLALAPGHRNRYALGARLQLAELAARTGDLPEARRLLLAARAEVGSGSESQGRFLDALAPLAMSSGDLALLDEAVAVLAHLVQDGDGFGSALSVLPPLWRGLADALEDRARSSDPRIGVVLERLERVTDRIPPAACPLDRVHTALVAAERERAGGRGDALARWRAAVDACATGDGVPPERAYAQVRMAQALMAAGGPLPEVEDLLDAAARTARELGAAPLVELVARTAASGRAPGPAPSAVPGASLTARESEVLTLVAAGLTNRRIARLLHISERTAAHHVSNMLGKIGVGSRGEAAAYAYRHGLAESGRSPVAG